MIIVEIQPEPHVSYSLNGTELTIGGIIVIDLEEEQEDTQNIIDVCEQDGELIVGLGNAYVATIVIPSAQYELVDTEEVDEYGNPVYIYVKKPLDTETVTLYLWQYPIQ